MATTPLTSYSPLTGEQSFDVAVIGGGITGLTTALLLAREGATVGVIEADRLCSSTTGYTTAKLTSLHGLTYASIAEKHGEEEAGRYGQANEAAIQKVFELVAQNGIQCDLERMPAFTYALEAGEVSRIEQEVEVAQRLGLPASFTTQTGLPFEVAAAVRFDNQAMFHPRKYCLALAELIVEEGCQIFEVTTARAIEPDADGVTVVTPEGRIRAKHVIQATQVPFYDPVGFFTRNIPSLSYGLAIPIERDLGPRGMYLSAGSPTRSLRPYFDGEQNYLIVGGEGHRVGKDQGTNQRYSALESWANTHFGAAEPAFRWSAHDYIPDDGVPYIGRLTPDNDRLWVATGFKKWGLTNGTVAAMVLTDSIAGRQNPWAKTFDSLRLKPKPSAKNQLKKQAEMAQRSAERRSLSLSLPEIQTLPAGEGRVFDSEGHKVAAYRDEQGEVHASSAVCTHMACDVSFNRADKTWDCPCHGSRFDRYGGVVHGPTINNLLPVRLSPEMSGAQDEDA